MESPLSKPNIAELRKEAASLAQCRLKIEKMKQAGLDPGEAELRCEHLQKSLQQLLDVYGPNFAKPGT